MYLVAVVVPYKLLLLFHESKELIIHAAVDELLITIMILRHSRDVSGVIVSGHRQRDRGKQRNEAEGNE